MGPFSMFVAIVFIVVMGKCIKAWLVAKAATPAQSDPAVQQEINRLRERVASLEKIVTAPTFDLRRQFAELEAAERQEQRRHATA